MSLVLVPLTLSAACRLVGEWDGAAAAMPKLIVIQAFQHGDDHAADRRWQVRGYGLSKFWGEFFAPTELHARYALALSIRRKLAEVKP